MESINRTNPARLGTNSSTVAYTVTFSEAVTDVSANDFDLALTGTATGTIGQVSPSSTSSSSVYTVTVSSISGSGSLGLNLVDNNTIHDSSGNHLVQVNGQPTFNRTDIPVGPSGPDSVAVAELTSDGKFDVVVANGGERFGKRTDGQWRWHVPSRENVCNWERSNICSCGRCQRRWHA